MKYYISNKNGLCYSRKALQAEYKKEMPRATIQGINNFIRQDIARGYISAITLTEIKAYNFELKA